MERTQKHPMGSLVFICVAAITCGADTWDEVEAFGEAKSTSMTRYFITTMQPQAKFIGAAARAHWSIENGLHWQLGVSYREDAGRERKDHAPSTSPPSPR